MGCDDGRVEKLGPEAGFTIVACISWDARLRTPVDGALGLVRVDGVDASSVLAGLVLKLGAAGKPVLLDSLTIAGFNIVSPPALERLVGSPVLAVYNYRPSMERLVAGLRSSGLPLAGERMRVLSLVEGAVEAETPRGTVYLVAWGMEAPEAVRLAVETQVYGRKPEPVRIAHYTASEASEALKRG
ncbi:uncharacterized conserved protein [Aeropyrum camini SY1 = JCM 12091]|uniref:UPF0215 protein ACAM_0369 n=1 Tax=Aeropyrum camini SY1 = JCM 12091 TaxID=1198449 RepID=U3TCY9_9CREN|nr:uncharacterized conserved protein [Aeropyrum camini SY1 = JCM 12091]